MDPFRAQQVESKFGVKMMGSNSFWSAIMNATDPQFDRLVRRAAQEDLQVEAMFGDKALSTNSFWSAIAKPLDASEWARLVRRAQQVEAMSAASPSQ